MCWVQVIIAIIVAIVGELIRPKPKTAGQKPAGLGDFQFPTAEAGRPFPLIAGTVKLLGPNTTASGGLRQEESYQRVKSGWFSTSKQHLGWRYYMTFQQVMCGGPIDDCQGIQVNDKFIKATINRTTDYIDVVVNDPGFFGDPKQEGGLAGTCRIYKGTTTQPADPDLLSICPGQTQVSAYRRVCHAIFKKFYIGMSTTPAAFQFVVSRYPNSLGVTGNKHIINTRSANPLCFAYDIMIDTARGMCLPPSAIDTTAFLACATTVFNEGIGVNLIFDSSMSGQDALNAIMAYCDGQIFEDPFTGLWTVKLIRNDYTVANLIVLNEDNSRCVGRTKTDWADTKNTINIGYVDQSKNWTNQSVQVQDLGNIQALGGQIQSTDIDFSGCDNAALANFLAERARAAMATPFTQLEIESFGLGATLRINDTFVAQYPTKRIAQMVMRITDITYPSVDKPVTQIKCTEDKFGVAYVAFTAQSTNAWAPPSWQPVAPTQYGLMELPYAMTPNLSATIWIATVAARADGISDSYNVLDTNQSNAITNTVTDLTSAAKMVNALLASDITAGTTLAQALKIGSVVDQNLIPTFTAAEYGNGQGLMWIGTELIAYQGYTDNGDGTLSVWPWQRAAYDTIPEDHPVGQDVYFLSSGLGLSTTVAFPSNVSASYRIQMQSSGNVVAVASSPNATLTTSSRAVRPYPPGNVAINGTRIQTVPTTYNPASSTITVTWAHRNRLAQGNTVYNYTSSAIAAGETGQTYTVNTYNADTNALLNSQTGIAGTSTTITTAQLGSSFGGNIRIEISSQANSLSSLFTQKATFQYTFRLTKPDGGRLLAPNGNFLRKP